MTGRGRRSPSGGRPDGRVVVEANGVGIRAGVIRIVRGLGAWVVPPPPIVCRIRSDKPRMLRRNKILGGVPVDPVPVMVAGPVIEAGARRLLVGGVASLEGGLRVGPTRPDGPGPLVVHSDGPGRVVGRTFSRSGVTRKGAHGGRGVVAGRVIGMTFRRGGVTRKGARRGRGVVAGRVSGMMLGRRGVTRKGTCGGKGVAAGRVIGMMLGRSRVTRKGACRGRGVAAGGAGAVMGAVELPAGAGRGRVERVGAMPRSWMRRVRWLGMCCGRCGSGMPMRISCCPNYFGSGGFRGGMRRSPPSLPMVRVGRWGCWTR